MNLKDYARSKGTNIKKLAEQIGVTPSTLYAISNGSTDFDHIGIFMRVHGVCMSGRFWAQKKSGLIILKPQ